MVRDGTVLGDGSQPCVVVTCPADVWDHTFGLHGDQCLIVRPDQHIAYRGPVSDIDATLARLFAS